MLQQFYRRFDQLYLASLFNGFVGNNLLPNNEANYNFVSIIQADLGNANVLSCIGCCTHGFRGCF